MNRTRLPLAEMSIFSVMLAPLNSSVSMPAWPSTVSLPSPGFQTKVSLPAPSSAVSLPRPPLIEVVAVAADEDVVAVAAVERQLDLAGRERRGVDGVVAAEAVDRQLCRAASTCAMRHRGRQGPLTVTVPPLPDDLDRVGAGGAVDDDGVGLAVAGAAAGAPPGRG